MKNLLLILALLISVAGFSQRLHKLEDIDYTPLTLSPLIFDIDMDSTIIRIEFVQDTTHNIYEADEEAKFSCIEKRENFEQVFAIGVIGDYRVRGNMVSVIIKTYHTNGEIKTFQYAEKINRLTFYNDFEWATYGTKGVYYFQYDQREIRPEIYSRCDI